MLLSACLFLSWVTVSCNAFVIPNLEMGRTFSPALVTVAAAASIDFQADESQYGRGEFHLSADLNEGDVVVYQTGTWFVDGVQVGDGSAADWKLARVETMQVVWTHNCEHGVLRGMAVELMEDGKTIQYSDDDGGGEAMVEFGPEQLVARLPVVWNDSIDRGVAENETLNPSMWRQEEGLV